jgi:hypothetical protein
MSIKLLRPASVCFLGLRILALLATLYRDCTVREQCADKYKALQPHGLLWSALRFGTRGKSLTCTEYFVLNNVVFRVFNLHYQP